MNFVDSLLEMASLLDCSPDAVLALSAKLLGVLYFAEGVAFGVVGYGVYRLCDWLLSRFQKKP